MSDNNESKTEPQRVADTVLANNASAHWPQAAGQLKVLGCSVESWPALAAQMLLSPAPQAAVSAQRLLQLMQSSRWSVEPAEAAPATGELLMPIEVAGQRHCLVLRREPLQLQRLLALAAVSPLLAGIQHEA